MSASAPEDEKNARSQSRNSNNSGCDHHIERNTGIQLNPEEQGILGATPRYYATSPFGESIGESSGGVTSENATFLTSSRYQTPSPGVILSPDSPDRHPNAPANNNNSTPRTRNNHNHPQTTRSATLPQGHPRARTTTHTTHTPRRPPASSSAAHLSRGRSRMRKPRKQYRRPDSKHSKFSNFSNGGSEETTTTTPSNSILETEDGDDEYSSSQFSSSFDPVTSQALTQQPIETAPSNDSPTSVTDAIGPAWFRAQQQPVQQQPYVDIQSHPSQEEYLDNHYHDTHDHDSNDHNNNDIDEHNQEWLQAAASWTSGGTNHDEVASFDKGPPQDALVVLKDNAVDTFSSHIMAYASPVLARHLKPSRSHNQMRYCVHIPHGNVEEWKQVKPYLQPHSVQRAAITTHNLATLLPWFHELQLDLLLTECDQLLSSLTFASLDPTTQDWVDILLLAQVCGTVNSGLPDTWQLAFDTIGKYVVRYPATLCTDKTLLDSVMTLLRDYPRARNALWDCVAVYLPQDLLEETSHNDDTRKHLVKNSLFPYLWREGLHKRAAMDKELRMREAEKERLQRWHQRKKDLERAGVELEEMQNYNSILADESGDSLRMGDEQFFDTAGIMGSPHMFATIDEAGEDDEEEDDDVAYDDHDDKSVQAVRGAATASTAATATSDAAAAAATAASQVFAGTVSSSAWAEFSDWWQSWASSGEGRGGNDNGAGVCDDDLCGDTAGSSEQKQLAQTVPIRTAWLQSVLLNLQRTPLFGVQPATRDTEPPPQQKPEPVPPRNLGFACAAVPSGLVEVQPKTPPASTNNRDSPSGGIRLLV